MARKTDRNYFTQDTEDAIIEYIQCDDPEIKSKIYGDRIHHSFFKLTENIIHTFKFYYTEVDNIQDLQFELMEFCLDKIKKYKQEKGKAYSYFGTIIKRWLILYNKANYKKLLNNIKINEGEYDNEKIVHENLITSPDKDDEVFFSFFNIFTKYMEENLQRLFPKPKDFKIAAALLELFYQKDKIEIFNKKAIYLILKEMTNSSTPQITKIVNKFYKKYKELYNIYLEKDYI